MDCQYYSTQTNYLCLTDLVRITNIKISLREIVLEDCKTRSLAVVSLDFIVFGLGFTTVD